MEPSRATLIINALSTGICVACAIYILMMFQKIVKHMVDRTNTQNEIIGLLHKLYAILENEKKQKK